MTGRKDPEMTHSVGMATKILSGKTILETLNQTWLVTRLELPCVNCSCKLFIDVSKVHSQKEDWFLPDYPDLEKDLHSQAGIMFSSKAKGVR